MQLTFAQEKTISGIVSDGTGLPLPGATVLVKGTSSGTSSDFDGKYAIKANTGDILVFSFVGYTSKEITVGASSTINVTLSEDAAALEEVVITAFGQTRQARSVGFASTKVDSDELTEVVNANPFESLSGKIAGVDISAPAQPGASTKVISRGLGSITGSNNPLYIVDGTPILNRSSSGTTSTSSFDAGSGATDIDPNNVETINFLKGAAATALYGSRAANGAIIITTKKGKGKLKVEISSSIDFSEVAKLVDAQQQFGTGWSGLSYSFVSGEGSTAASNENGSWGAEFDGQLRTWSRIVNDSQLLKPYVPLEDNLREFFDIGNTYTNSVTVSGASDKANASFTYSRVDSDGVFPTEADIYLKNNFGLNAGLTYDKLKIRASANYVTKTQNAVPTGQGDDAGFGKSLMQELIQIPNDISIIDLEDQSNIFNTPSYFYTPYATNPYTTLSNNKIGINKNRFFGNLNLSYAITDNISASFQIGGDIENEYVKRTGAVLNYIEGSPQDLAGANAVVGAVGEYKYTNKEFDTYFNLNYNKNLSDNLTFNALLGFNYNQREGESLSTVVTDLDLPGYYEISNSAGTPTISQNDYLRRGYAAYTSLEFGYVNRYFLTLTARNDNTSTLPVGNNSYIYPSLALAAVVLDNNSSFVKLRGSIARVGNDTGTYLTESVAGQASNAGYFGSLSYPFGGVNSYEIYGQIANPNLKPEITDEIELGLDASFFNNRLGVDLALYNRDTKDLIVSLDVPRSTGYSSVTGNFVDLTNKGIELTLTGKPIVSKDFTWDVTYTFSKNDSEVTDVAGDQDQIDIYSAYETYFRAEVGKPLGVFYAPSPDTTEDGQIIVDPATGYYSYDGTEDYQGTSQRDFIMGLQNVFTYKNFRLGVNWDWKQGGVMYSYTKRLSYFVGNGIETTYNNRQSFIVPNSVVDNGDGTYSENTTYVDYEDITGFYSASSNQAIENEHIIDKSFVRLRSLSLAYNVNRDFLEPLGLTGLSFSVYGKNLFLWTPSDNTYVDPETSTYGFGIRSEFGEFGTNPSQRTYGATVKLSF
ncbi:hypothetical protein PW52_01170 [Tamlana sedimentorum]|uniref:TonB-dependent receptor n=1 Tax=Neotamlana sedimentorum TaxID=1435349 RepID=A0A0D7WDZ1_9FLAO|nr:hypothetical protein PW52_01170 [Tamlana sedimentorum]